MVLTRNNLGGREGVAPGAPPDIRKTSVDRSLDEWTGLDTEILANQRA
jgi:hypothetical protein